MPRSLEERRIEALEEALLEYVGRYGPTKLAKRAFSLTAKTKVVAPTKSEENTEGEGKSEVSDE
jgi:hypothetical protein